MRVAVVHNLSRGGARRTLAEHLRFARWEIKEFCLGTAVPVTRDAAITPLEPRAPSAPPMLRPPLRYLDLAALTRAWARLAEEVNDFEPDLVLAHPCQFLQAPPAITDFRPRTLYFCHECRRVDYEPAAKQSRRGITRVLYAPMYRAERLLDQRSAGAADCVATNSSYTRSEIARIYGRDATVVQLGVPPGFRPALPGGQKHHLLSVGSLIPSKGHDLVIATAAAAAHPRPLIVVAPRPDHSEAHRLHGLADDVGIEFEIRVGVSDAELRQLYQTAFATLYLARAEPLGLVALEAQACGCPVIVSREGGLPETIEDGESGWAVVRDPGAAATVLDRLEDDELWRSSSASAAAHGLQYTWEESTRQLELLMEATLAAEPVGVTTKVQPTSSRVNTSA